MPARFLKVGEVKLDDSWRFHPQHNIMALHAWLRKLHNKNSVGWTVFLFGAVNQYRCGHCNRARVQTKAIIRRPFGGGGLSSVPN